MNTESTVELVKEYKEYRLGCSYCDNVALSGDYLSVLDFLRHARNDLGWRYSEGTKTATCPKCRDEGRYSVDELVPSRRDTLERIFLKAKKMDTRSKSLIYLNNELTKREFSENIVHSSLEKLIDSWG